MFVTGVASGEIGGNMPQGQPMHDKRRTKRRLQGGLGAIVLFSVVPFAILLTSVSAGSAAGGTGYVALGDSYTSGPLIPVQSTNPPGCLRSNHNYPSDTAVALGLRLTDMSCSGATTAEMYSSQELTSGFANPAQLSALNVATRVVSLGIGGDDVGFTSIVENCLALTPWGPTAVGSTCKGYYDPNGHDALAAAINALGPRIVALLQRIHTLAPSAKIFVVGYPSILPVSGACWPSMPFETSDAQYLTAKEIQLNQMLQGEANSHGATYVDTYAPSTSHNACTSEATRWVEPLVPSSLAAPIHPNAAGESAVAGLLERAMQAEGVS